jgi:serine/threonine-protein kinase
VWSPDGSRIAFASDRGKYGVSNLYWQRADGAGEAERLTESEYRQVPGSWHPSGKFLAFHEIRPPNTTDLMVLPMEEGASGKPGKPAVFLSTAFAELFPAFSPDGRWLAYQSNESGRPEVYVVPFPGPGGKWQVSTNGGSFPTWSPARREVFYVTLEERIISVASYTVEGDSFRPEKPRVWSAQQLAGRQTVRIPGTRYFDVHPDGLRVAVLKAPEGARVRQDKLVFILNFFDYLHQIAPPGETR